MAPAERFFAKVEKTETCWLWRGAVNSRQYGCFGAGRSKSVLAHRWSYEHHVGPIPRGLQIDHLCRVTTCVNPAHLEPVTARVNVRRGTSGAAENAKKTSCIHGHELAGANLYTRRDGRRQCRTCKRIENLRYLTRKAAAA